MSRSAGFWSPRPSSALARGVASVRAWESRTNTVIPGLGEAHYPVLTADLSFAMEMPAAGSGISIPAAVATRASRTGSPMFALRASISVQNEGRTGVDEDERTSP